MAFEPLTIPPQQMHVFGLAAGEKARPRFIDHCWEQFPDLCEELGEDEVARLVRAGMAKAAENGYDTFADTLSIVEMTVVYGENFEETEAWVRPIWEAAPPPLASSPPYATRLRKKEFAPLSTTKMPDIQFSTPAIAGNTKLWESGQEITFQVELTGANATEVIAYIEPDAFAQSPVIATFTPSKSTKPSKGLEVAE